MDNVLKLPVNEYWYNLIKEGKLTHDYREIKPYWTKRLEGKTYDIVEFYHRFKKDIEPLRYKFEWIKKGRIVNYNMDAYIIKFGERIDNIKENLTNPILKYLEGKSYLYHATPSCYLNSIKKYGLGGKLPKKRFWDYENTEYSNISKGCFLATDEDVAYDYLDASDDFYDFAEEYEETYDKELKIIILQININDLDTNLLSIDTNQQFDDENDPTFFYNGVIPFDKIKIIK